MRALTTDKNLGGEIIHVGSGQNKSVIDIIDALEKVWGRKLEKDFKTMRPGETKIEIALQSEKLKSLLDYELQWDLETGLKETIPYYEKAFKETN